MFHIRPDDLHRRRERCRGTVAAVEVLGCEAQACCNICGSARSIVLAGSDRYGFRVRTAMCLDCGLVYLADRLPPEGYARFYGSGAYRTLSAQFTGVPRTVESLRGEQVAYSAHTLATLERFVPAHPGLRLLDVGGSTGVVAAEFAKRFSLEATVLDPAPQEVAAARTLGLNGVVGTVETYDEPRRFDLVLLCRSIEHLLDLRSALARIRALLKPDGLFYCDVIDYLESCRATGAPQTVSKMDHCYWLCQETAPLIFRSVGFEIVSASASFDPAVIGYVLRRGEARAVSGCAAEQVSYLVRRLREIDADWRESARQRSPAQQLRRVAYRARRKATHAAEALRAAAAGCFLPAEEKWEVTLGRMFRDS